MGPGHLGVSRAIRRRGGNNVGSTASVIVDRGERVRWNEDGRGGIRHVVDCQENLDKVMEGLSNFVGAAKAEDVLVEAFIKVVEDGIRGSQVEDKSGDEN